MVNATFLVDGPGRRRDGPPLDRNAGSRRARGRRRDPWDRSPRASGRVPRHPLDAERRGSPLAARVQRSVAELSSRRKRGASLGGARRRAGDHRAPRRDWSARSPPRRAARSIAAAITEDLRRSQAELAESQQRTQKLIETLPNPVFFKGLDGRYLGVNQAWEQFFGTPREQIVGRTVHELYPHDPAVAQRLAAMDDVLWQSRGRRCTRRRSRWRAARTATLIYYKATFTGPDGKVAGLIGNIIDVTEQKRAERRLRMEHAVTRVLAEAENTQAGLKGVMRAICEAEGWDCARAYLVDEHAGVLRFGEAWGIDHEGVTNFIERTRDMVFSPGQDLAGRAWQSRRAGVERRHLGRPARDPPLRLRLRHARRLRPAAGVGGQDAGRRRFRQPRGARARRAAARGGGRDRQPGRPVPDPQAGRGSGALRRHPRRAHQAAEPRHVRAAPRARAQPGDAARAAPGGAVHRPRPLQDHQRHARPRRRRRAAARGRRAACGESLRASDTVARLGGDEFVVLLEELSDPMYVTAVAQQAARRARPAGGARRARVPRHRQHRRQRLPRRRRPTRRRC